MICLTCNIPCNNICPCCMESVFSKWHTTEDANNFAKLVKNGDIDVSKYIETYKNSQKAKTKKKSWFSKIFI